MEAVRKKAPVGLFGPRMLLDSFYDQSSRDILATLSLRVQLGRLENHGRTDATPAVTAASKETPMSSDKDTLPSGIGSNENGQQQANAYTEEFDKAFRELSALCPRVQKTLLVLDLLSMQVRDEDMAGDIQIRAGIHGLLRCLFSDLLSASKSNDPFQMLHKGTDMQSDDTCSRMRSLSLSSYGFKPDHTETNYLWTLVRPGKSPRDLVRMFLLLSARAAQLQRSHVEPDAIVAVGSQWYSLLADLCVQLGLSAYEFGDWTLKDIQAASRLFEPGAREHSEVYSVLWNIRNKDDIENFDANWKAIQKLTKGLGNARTVEKSAGDLYERCSPHSFCNKLCVYFTAVLDFLEPPTLDYYTSIRQVERLPYGFFNTANNVAVQGLPNSPHVDDDDEEQIAMDTNIMLLDPFSPQAQRAISNLHIRDSGGVCRSPSERVAQAHAYNTMSSESNHTQTGSLAAPPIHGVASSSSASETLLHHSGLARMPTSPRLESESALMLDDDGFDSDESDMEMSPSRHASSKRQKSNEHVSSPSKQITPRRNGHSRPSAEGMDIDSSVILESPSAMLSAKHDKRMKKSVLMRTQAPPALSFGPVKNGSPSVEANDANSGHAAVNSSAITTPKSQTGEKMVDTPKYVAGRAYGDVEGGGRPHRRRHNADSFGTPKAARSSVLEPPPQTLLSPRNIAAARRNNIGLDALVSQYENHTSDNVVMDLTNTPQRSNNAAEMLKDLETTPENQIGQAADAQASSVSRYVKRKDQGDIEGGGRKHRNRQRGGGYDPLLFMGSS